MNGPRDYAPPHIRAVNPPGINPQDMQPLPRSLQRNARTDGVSEDTLATLAEEVQRVGALNMQERPVGKHPALAMPYDNPTPTDPYKDIASMARRPTLLENLAEILCRLPYGDMVELAAGIVSEQPLVSQGQPADVPWQAQQLATCVHAWAKKTYDAR